MTGFNYRDFYQITPIPINESDLQAIECEDKYEKMFAGFTHWLLALEGLEAREKKYAWRVVIFPSNEIGSFNQFLPYFQSPYHATFHEAIACLREMELKAKNDQLIATPYLPQL
ncbi:hypothetical protein EKG37_04160 [Robertmurraya yapensis]|uniref:Uncharacterized protein n=2 Tax=Bacillaceae TaxID=186817 RepID=A0A3S0II01_9BACI|nr:hypothetical protein [Bacillus yapensis]RTR35833.1 hypothetical protein EKG37_04160 [Bacillus yapensis]TKS98635.1 hypothetical protein FAR12_04160 [Bacillus yapensis]